ncbi:hypothetical protein HaLaN_29707 [Haematococcus lacustris]|uniref:Uncharacterized protein n=1 Tax=Haematococcus lacustris TaxID=44745 RepID=A0A6A0AG02_HAELA|nr:hypothetical protein HaLaN_29707 [Haematococcus lacustris]
MGTTRESLARITLYITRVVQCGTKGLAILGRNRRGDALMVWFTPLKPSAVRLLGCGDALNSLVVMIWLTPLKPSAVRLLGRPPPLGDDDVAYTA